MKVLKPDYFDRFHCIAGACPDSCCKEWEVDVDAESAAYYRALPGDLGDRLRSVLRDADGGVCMTITDRRCPMWRQDGLCHIQAELGHDALCQTCRDFPRLRHDYGNFVELGLELSCPEAARLILTASAQMIPQDAPDGDDPLYDKDVMSTLLRTRQAFIHWLDESECAPAEALTVLLFYGCEVQNEIDGGDAAILSPADALCSGKEFAEGANISDIFAFFQDLEILTPTWRERLSSAPVNAPWDARQKALLRYFIQRHWLQAVSDFDLICRIKFMIIACLLINALGGDFVATAQQFSKEIENDLDNLEAIFDGAYTYAGFTDRKLLGLLLNP